MIRARIAGGNAARGDFIVFLDAHCRVSPRWLESPHRLLMEVHVVCCYQSVEQQDDRQLCGLHHDGGFQGEASISGHRKVVSRVQFDGSSSATIENTLRQFWGGGSYNDDYTPITMGMFAITKYWWQQGQMDPALNIWGGENVEISFRTWLCGGRIVVAKDSYVAHYFRTKPTYSVGEGRVSEG